MPNEKKMKRLEELLDSFDAGAVSPEELIQAIEAVMAIIDQNGRTLVDKIVEIKAATDDDVTGLRSELTKTRDNLQTVINQVKDNLDTSVSSVKKALLSEIKRVEALIPVLPPETDLSDVFGEIESQKQSLANLSVLIAGENIRNALESLQGDDRLDKSAIKGFDEEVGKSTSKYMKDGIGLVVRQIRAGTNITIDDTNQEYPIVSSTGGSGSGHTIEDEGTPLTARTKLNFVGAGVTVTDDAGDDATVVTINGGSLTVETPTGTVNGTNVTFTVTATPKWIVADNTTYFQNFGYTLAALTVTMDLAPNLFIRSIS